MKINVVKDERGKVVATFEDAAAGAPSLKPVLKPGHTVQKVETQENYKKDLQGFYRQHSR
ncbi:MAG TPA: hypothetical protein VK695_13665 [Steroidobacteraceae bacterium]|jgi:hypothetical protein|nr:hypothetical protein [Steroidobacteraceae bacterium]